MTNLLDRTPLSPPLSNYVGLEVKVRLGGVVNGHWEQGVVLGVEPAGKINSEYPEWLQIQFGEKTLSIPPQASCFIISEYAGPEGI